MNNAQIAAAFEELADLYELDGAVQYRVLAYRTAAKAVRESSVSVAQMVRDGKVTEIPGIGKTLESKLVALDETGEIPQAVKLREKFPPGLIAITHLPGFGPKRARRLFDELGIDSLEALRAACERQEVRKLRGFGEKVEQQLLEALAAGADGTPAPRILLSRALPIAQQIAEALRSAPGAHRVEVAGSLRRQVDAVKDLDVIATADDTAALVAALEQLPVVDTVQQSGPAGARAMTHAGLKVDLKVVAPDQFGNVLQHFTGAKAHNVQLREAAVRRGSGCRSSSRSCARAAASWRRRARARSRRSSGSRTCAATCTRTPSPPTATRTSRRWRRAPASAATSTWRSPTTRRRTASATTSTSRRSSSRSSACGRSTRRWATTSRC
jgi:DNA polymerase (family 10)